MIAKSGFLQEKVGKTTSLISPKETIHSYAHPHSLENFIPGQRYGDGIVQRHILHYHGNGFSDFFRICGDFLCIEIDPALIEESEWDIDPELVEKYAALCKKKSQKNNSTNRSRL
jgi:hypothetical protein